MSAEALTCMACGVTSHDVRATVVEYPEPAPIAVAIVTAEDQAAVRGMDYRTVPERYGAEYRCTDARACLARRPKLMAPAEPAPAVAAEPEPEPELEPSSKEAESWF